MLTIFLGWLRGFVVLHISGGGQERLLNLALQRDIDVYDINWLADDLLEVKAGWREVGQLKKIAKVCGCNLQTRRNQGLPFVYRYLRRRKTLAAGLLLFALGLLGLSQVVFQVQVLPQESLMQLDTQTVLRQAEELGIKPGALWRRLDFDQLAEELKQDIEELSWVYIERQGTILNIKIAERSIYPEELENATIGAIWANRDALIEDVLIKHGQAMVQHGDTVQKGTLLVSPLADGRADAIVKARVWYEGYGEGALREEIVQAAEESRQIFSLSKGEAQLQIWGWPPKADGENMTLAREHFTRELPLDWLLSSEQTPPLEVEVICAQTVFWRQNSEEEAKAQAMAQATASLQAQIADPNSQLLNEEVTYQLLEGDVWAATVRWECLEEIGERKR